MTAGQATELAAQQDTARTALAAPNAESANKAAGTGAEVQPGASQSPVPVPLVLGLGALMLAFAVAAWIVRRNTARRIRGQWNQK